MTVQRLADFVQSVPLSAQVLELAVDAVEAVVGVKAVVWVDALDEQTLQVFGHC